MHFSLVKRGWRGMFSFGSIARVHPLFVFKYFFYTSKSDDITTFEGGNLAASKIRNLECPSYEICLIDYGCGKFNRKIHIMEQYP